MTSADLVRAWAAMQVHYAPAWRRRWQAALDRVGPRLAAGGRLVDLGCGPGELTAHAAYRLPHVEVIGLDRCAELTTLASAHFSQVPNLRFVAGSLDALSQPVDAIVSSALLHYVTTDTLAEHLHAVLAVLNPGGVVVHAETWPPTRASTGPWQQWWAAAGLQPPGAGNGGDSTAPVGQSVSPQECCQAALAAGFAHAEVVLVDGDDVLVILDLLPQP